MVKSAFHPASTGSALCAAAFVGRQIEHAADRPFSATCRTRLCDT
jgi:hypothetical protein